MKLIFFLFLFLLFSIISSYSLFPLSSISNKIKISTNVNTYLNTYYPRISSSFLCLAKNNKLDNNGDTNNKNKNKDIKAKEKEFNFLFEKENLIKNIKKNEENFQEKLKLSTNLSINFIENIEIDIDKNKKKFKDFFLVTYNPLDNSYELNFNDSSLTPYSLTPNSLINLIEKKLSTLPIPLTVTKINKHLLKVSINNKLAGTREFKENILKYLMNEKEHYKIILRNYRKHFNDQLKNEEKKKTMSKDTIFKYQVSLSYYFIFYIF